MVSDVTSRGWDGSCCCLERLRWFLMLLPRVEMVLAVAWRGWDGFWCYFQGLRWFLLLLGEVEMVFDVTSRGWDGSCCCLERLRWFLMLLPGVEMVLAVAWRGWDGFWCYFQGLRWFLLLVPGVLMNICNIVIRTSCSNPLRCFNPSLLLTGSWMFDRDYLDHICCSGCLICMCFIVLYLYLFSTVEHVSHGQALKKCNHYCVPGSSAGQVHDI